MRRSLFPIVAIISLLALEVRAEIIRTSYLSFEVPDNWACAQEESSWTCHPTDPKIIRTGSLILSAKLARPEETLSSIEQQFRTPKTITGPHGEIVSSKLVSFRTIDIHGQKWLEAEFSDREAVGYSEIYYAAKTDALVILLALHFQSPLSATYKEAAAKISANLSLLPYSAPSGAPKLVPTAVGGSPTGTEGPPPGAPGPGPESTSAKPGGRFGLILLAAILVILGLALALRSRKGR